MARYIDTSKVTIPEGFFEDLNVPKLLEWLNNQPTADVVAVVRCKDCVHRFRDPDGDFCCDLDDCYAGDTGFCSYGKRREI